jgi:hypothetical protein
MAQPQHNSQRWRTWIGVISIACFVLAILCEVAFLIHFEVQRSQIGDNANVG